MILDDIEQQQNYSQWFLSKTQTIFFYQKIFLSVQKILEFVRRISPKNLKLVLNTFRTFDASQPFNKTV